jgi:hypothetical protein
MSRGTIDVHWCKPRLVVSGLVDDHRRRRASSERSWRVGTSWTDSVDWRREGKARIAVAEVTSRWNTVGTAALEKQRRTGQAWRLNNSVGVCGRMNVLRTRCCGKLGSRCLRLL